MLRALLLACLALPAAAQADTVTVFAAASLRTALDRIVTEYEEGGDDEVTISYAGSSTLAKQVIAGAPAEIFISASTDWMDAVEAAGQVADGTRRDLLGNRLIVVGPAGSAPLNLPALPEALGAGYLAMALVDSVPAGVYGQQALRDLGLWEAVAPKVAQASDVRAALALVATAEARFGIVYASDAVAEPRVATVATFPPESHDPIIYPAALVGDDPSAAARAFLDHLSSNASKAIFEDEGFEVLN